MWTPSACSWPLLPGALLAGRGPGPAIVERRGAIHRSQKGGRESDLSRIAAALSRLSGISFRLKICGLLFELDISDSRCSFSAAALSICVTRECTRWFISTNRESIRRERPLPSDGAPPERPRAPRDAKLACDASSRRCRNAPSDSCAAAICCSSAP